MVDDSTSPTHKNGDPMHSTAKIGRAAVVTALVAGVSVVAHPVVARAGGAGQDATQQGGPQQGTTAKPGAQTPAVVAGQIITATATVQKVDKDKGTVTLKDSQGNSFEMKAGPHVDLDRLRPGAPVTATYYEEVAVAIRKAAQGAPKMTQTTVMRGGVAEQQATMTSRIESVDSKSNTVVIRTPDGGKHTLKVEDPALQKQLASIKPGEAFDITYQQGVALSVEPRK